MYPYCDEPIYSLQTLFVLRPWVSALFLIASGIGLAVLWIKLSRWWKLVPVMMAIALGGFAAFEPLMLQQKISSAHAILEADDWRNADEIFVLRGAPVKIAAYPISLGSKCNSGFIVDSPGPGSLENAYSPSPLHSYLERLHQYNNDDPYERCRHRNSIMLKRGEERDPKACDFRQPPLKFFDGSRIGSPGFEMSWCRSLNSEYSYCEADGGRVALALGYQF